jgi:hypothetical protein
MIPKAQRIIGWDISGDRINGWKAETEAYSQG